MKKLFVIIFSVLGTSKSTAAQTKAITILQTGMFAAFYLMSAHVNAEQFDANTKHFEHTVTNTIERSRLEAHVRFLSDDMLQGREAGSVGYGLAAGYVTGQFAAMGLEPAGSEGSFLQFVPKVSSKLILGNSAAIKLINKDGTEIMPSATSGVEYFTRPFIGETFSKIEGELVFVGYGFSSDGYEQDDFANIDLTDKIAVILRGAPSTLNSEERAHFGATVYERLSKRGAIGAIMLFTPTEEAQFPFVRLQQYMVNTNFMSWTDDNGKGYTSAPNIISTAILGPDFSEALFSQQAISWDDVVSYTAAERKSLPSFDMDMRATIVAEAQVAKLSSPNVLAYVPGSDPELADEYVAITAHLDHIGITPTPEDGDDEINNGAMDNAVGVAAILEVARVLKSQPTRRPIVFLALTAEEKGLIGADYFIRNPTLEGGSVVANINLDMPILNYAFTDIVAYGAERSNLFSAVKAAAESHDVTLSPDPEPEEGNFTRSDQYTFVEQGIPAVYLDTGWANGGELARADFLANHYHQVSDEISLVDFEQLRRFTELNYSIIKNVGNMKERPKWKAGDFFGKTFKGEMEE